MIEPDQLDEKLAGGGSGPTICAAAAIKPTSLSELTGVANACSICPGNKPSLPLVTKNCLVITRHFQFGGAHLHLMLRSSTVERPLQFVAIELVRAAERLLEHGELCCTVFGKLGLDLDTTLPGFPLTDDQILGAWFAAGRQGHNQAAQRYNRAISFHGDVPEVSRLSSLYFRYQIVRRVIG